MDFIDIIDNLALLSVAFYILNEYIFVRNRFSDFNMIFVYVSYHNIFVFVVIITNFAGVSYSVQELDCVDSLDKVIQR